MVNHGLDPVQNWWKPHTFAALPVPQRMRELLGNSQPILLGLQEKIVALTLAVVIHSPRARMQDLKSKHISGNWRILADLL
jgi:hypothetical protein